MFKKKGVPPKVKVPAIEESDESQDEDFFSSPEEEAFFKEPELGEGEESVEAAVPAEEEDSSTDEGFSFGEDLASEGDFTSDDAAEESFDAIEDFDAEETEEAPGGKKKLLLLLLLLVGGGYLAYAYILPQYFPDLLGPASKGQQVAKRNKIPQRVPIKAPKAPVKPAPSATKVEETAQPPKPSVDKVKEVTPGPIPEKAQKEASEKAVMEKVDAVGGEPEELPAHTVKPPPLAAGDVKFVTSSLPVAEKGMYFVQTGVYMFKGNVKEPQKKIQSLGYSPRVEVGRKVVNMNRLTVGHWSTAEEAAYAVDQLKGDGYDARIINIEGGGSSVLIGSYYYRNVAKEEKIILEARGYEATLVKKPIKMKVHHILVGPYGTPEEAASVEANLKSAGLKAAIIQSK